MKGQVVVSCAILAVHCAAAGQSETGKPAVPPSCEAPEYRQFDFWIGDWDVTTANGQPAGRNTITRVANGCALHENWVGRGGFTGQSLNGWNRHTKLWQQTWLDSSGARLDLAGAADATGLQLEGRVPRGNGRDGLLMHRIRWSRLPDGRVRQHWETSEDSGANWVTAFDGYYQRRGPETTRP